MKIFILFMNNGDDYSTLPKDAKIVHIFKHIKGTPNIHHIQKRLTQVLDTATKDDFIVFNGPSYLTALGGFIWFTQEHRENVNFFAYNVKDNAYVKHTEPLVLEETK